MLRRRRCRLVRACRSLRSVIWLYERSSRCKAGQDILKAEALREAGATCLFESICRILCPNDVTHSSTLHTVTHAAASSLLSLMPCTYSNLLDPHVSLVEQVLTNPPWVMKNCIRTTLTLLVLRLGGVRCVRAALVSSKWLRRRRQPPMIEQKQAANRIVRARPLGVPNSLQRKSAQYSLWRPLAEYID